MNGGRATIPEVGVMAALFPSSVSTTGPFPVKNT